MASRNAGMQTDEASRASNSVPDWDALARDVVRDISEYERPLSGSPDDETEFLLEAVQIFERLQRHRSREDRHLQRTFHAAGHVGIPRVELTLNSNVPAGMRPAFFGASPGKALHAEVRLSSADVPEGMGRRVNLRGLGVRIFNANPGCAHPDDEHFEITASTGGVFSFRNAEGFTRFAENMPRGNFRAILSTRHTEGIWGMLRILWFSAKSAIRPRRSLAAETYFGKLPYLMGDQVAQFRFVPRKSRIFGKHPIASSAADRFREDIRRRLAAEGITFDLQVKLFQCERRTPVEDASKAWRGDWQSIGQLNMTRSETGRQVSSDWVDSARRIESSDFEPWSDSSHFRPLGSLNRARRLVYFGSQRARQFGPPPALGYGPPVPDVGQWDPVGIRGRIRRLVVKVPGLRWWRPDQIVTGRRPIARITRWDKRRFGRGIRFLLNFRNRLMIGGIYRPVTHADRRSEIPPDFLYARSVDGRYNDINDHWLGAAHTGFGRNIHPASSAPGNIRTPLHEPNPTAVAARLLQRDRFKGSPDLSLIGAAWVQFMVHDWFGHGPTNTADGDRLRFDLDPAHPWRASGLTEMEINATAKPIYHGGPDDPVTFRNFETHWWDASQLYGSDRQRHDKIRTWRSGTIKVCNDGLIPVEPKSRDAGLEITGVNGNWWMGLSILHNLFAREHNAICAMLADRYPEWGDQQIFNVARLIVSALIAKIHTVEWTAALLPNHSTHIATRGNWSRGSVEQIGFAENTKISLALAVFNWMSFWKIPFTGYFQNKRDTLTRELGLPTTEYARPFAMTEEFVEVYRMHELLPDFVNFAGHIDDCPLGLYGLQEIDAGLTQQMLRRIGFANAMYTFGNAQAGALTLRNFPRSLMDVRRQLDRRQRPSAKSRRIDLATIDLVRQRERGVPRYNEFRKSVNLPPAASFEDLCGQHLGSDREPIIQALGDCYASVDDVDLHVGLMAEEHPKKVATGVTFLTIVGIIVEQRLNADRFYTTHYRPDVYTPEGIEWVHKNTMRTVVLRHFPELESQIPRERNFFKPWGTSRNAASR